MNCPKLNPTVIINRAVPGSGRTTLSKAIKQYFDEKGITSSIHSTDDYFFTKTDIYDYNIELLAEYHKRNLEAFHQALKTKVDLVICNNTNLSSWEATPYTEIAREFGYQVIIIDFIPREIENHVKSQVATKEKSYAHNLPEKTIIDMVVDYYKYEKLLYKSYKIQSNIDVRVSCDEDTLCQAKTDEQLIHYDADEIIRVYPNEYQKAKQHVPSTIFTLMTQDKNSLPFFIKEWLKLLKSNSNQANRYYFDNILPFCVDKIKKESKLNSCDKLISLMGFSPETTVLATVALNPKKLIVITGENTNNQYDIAVEFMIANGIIKASQVSLETVDIINVKEIYSIVEKESRTSVKDCSILVDITGGKKIMSAAAAQAAWEFDVSLGYIEGEYDPDIRRPGPTTEKMIILDNPSVEKATNKRLQGIYAWELGRFSLAEERFKESRKLNNNHNLEDIAIPLCLLYNSLFNFKIDEISDHVNILKNLLEVAYLDEYLSKINIKSLIGIFGADLMLEKASTRVAIFLFIAKEYSKQKRYEFSGLLSYRAIEALVDQGLNELSKTSFFDRKNPDYNLLKEDKSELEKEFIGLWKQVKKNKSFSHSLPKTIALADGFALLIILDDRYKNLFGIDNIKPSNVLQKVAGICSSRNESILAHGIKPLGKNHFQNIYDLAIAMSEILAGNEISLMVDLLSPPQLRELI